MRKILVLSFSVYGSTRWVAWKIAEQVGADWMEIKPAIPYDSDRNHYHALWERVQKEYEQNQRPAILDPLPIADYEVIFLGYPIWCFTLPQILRTLLEQYDFHGKTIIPFNTHMGSRDGGTYQLIRCLATGAKVLDGFSIEMGDVADKTPAVVGRWLAAQGIPPFAQANKA